MSYTTADLSPHVAAQLDLSTLTPRQLAEIAEAGEILDRHAVFDTHTHERCRDCMQNNRCADLHAAMAIYDRYDVVPQRPRGPVRVIREPRAMHCNEEVR